MQNIQYILYFLAVILVTGTLFAWYQFTVVWREHKCGQGTCDNPWTSKCFIGAVFFTLALGVTLYAIAIL